MDIKRVVSKFKIDKNLNDKECVYLEEVLHYVYNDGANKFLKGELFKSQELSSIRQNLLTSDRVLTEFIKKLERSTPETVKKIIHFYKNKLAEKSRQAHQSRSERKSIRSSMHSENIRNKYAPPSEDGSFPGGPGYLKLQKHFNRLQERNSIAQPSHKKQKTGGKRTKHKKHNINKTRRRRHNKHK